MNEDNITIDGITYLATAPHPDGKHCHTCVAEGTYKLHKTESLCAKLGRCGSHFRQDGKAVIWREQ